MTYDEDFEREKLTTEYEEYKIGMATVRARVDLEMKRLRNQRIAAETDHWRARMGRALAQSPLPIRTKQKITSTTDWGRYKALIEAAGVEDVRSRVTPPGGEEAGAKKTEQKIRVERLDPKFDSDWTFETESDEGAPGYFVENSDGSRWAWGSHGGRYIPILATDDFTHLRGLGFPFDAPTQPGEIPMRELSLLKETFDESWVDAVNEAINADA